MPLYDLNRDALQSYLPDLHEPADFDAFWADPPTQARTHDLALTLTPGVLRQRPRPELPC
jgi:cephalosporin-C deacetylase